MTPTRRTTPLICTLIALTLAGCLSGDDDQETLASKGFAVLDDHPIATSVPLSVDDIDWPNFEGETLRILDHGAFDWAFGEAGPLFERLTGATVEHTAAADTGSALQIAAREAGNPRHDVLYGIDNALWTAAAEAGIFAPYRPVLADRIEPELVFFDPAAGWPATPVDHGYIALNIDTDHAELGGANITITDLFDVRDHADLFVTQDPRSSTPGLGFLLITIGVFGDGSAYDWKDYWNDLFDNGVRITPDWTQAYEIHFSQGYGMFYDGFLGDRPVVTSYSESPAYEVSFDSFPSAQRADVLLDHRGEPAVFQQIQTMGILDGTRNLALAQAWIEFTLTDEFQALAAPMSAVYPVVAAVDASATYGGLDPEPGTFGVIDLDATTIGLNVEGWVQDWVALCEAADCI